MNEDKKREKCKYINVDFINKLNDHFIFHNIICLVCVFDKLCESISYHLIA